MTRPHRDRRRTERRSWLLFALVVLAFVVLGLVQRARERPDVADAARAAGDAAEDAVANTTHAGDSGA